MNKEFYQLYKNVKYHWCSDCDGECHYCCVKDILNQIEDLDASLDTTPVDNVEGCFVCQDKKGKSQDVFYFDKANNMREANFCPNCGADMRSDDDD